MESEYTHIRFIVYKIWFMTWKIIPLESVSTHSDAHKKWTEIHTVTESTSFSVDRLLNKQGGIDFDILIRFLEQDTVSIQEFFQEKKHIEKILFPFFDHLKHSYYSENKIIPQNIIDILTNNITVQDGVLAYIEERNSHIISSEHIEQYDTITFHLFLLGMDQDFDLVQDIQVNNFRRIDALFSDINSLVFEEIGAIKKQRSGVIKPWIEQEKRESMVLLSRELNYCIQIGETINKLALIHAVNFEERQISFKLGVIITTHIDALLRKLDPIFVEEHIIGKKLRHLSGKVQCNFAHGVILNGSNIHEIKEQISRIKKEQIIWFEKQQASGFSWDADKEKIAKLVLLGNQTITELVGIERIGALSGSSPEEIQEKNIWFLRTLGHIYNQKQEFNTTREVIDDFIQSSINNEYQIEVIYYIVLFDTNIPKESLIHLTNFLLSNTKQIKNFFYEEFLIKILAQIIRKFDSFSDYYHYISIVQSIHVAIKERNISHSILSYSKVYLSLALYYIRCKGDAHIESAKMCFLHYKNLNTPIIGIDKNPQNTQDENNFYIALWTVDEVARYGKHLHDEKSMIQSGMYIFERTTAYYRQMALLSIETEVEKIIVSLNGDNNIFSQNQINDILGKKITETMFYNLCTITIVGGCNSCSTRPMNTACESSQNSTESGTSICPLIPTKRGFQNQSIALEGGMFIVFNYPTISENIFKNIFLQQEALIRERFWNLIAINNKNTQLRKTKEEMEKLALYDTETGLPNEHKLERDIHGQEVTLALIEVVGYDSIIETQGGKESWSELMKKITAYLNHNENAVVYRYDKTTFCLICHKENLTEIAISLQQDLKETITTLISALLTNFYADYGKNMHFHTGIVLWHTEEHVKKAHVALTKAKNLWKGNVYIFEDGDEKLPEEMRHNKNILVAAMDPNNPSTEIIPYYQYIHDPKNPKMQKLEALARIKHRQEDGTEKIIFPDTFIDIAMQNRWLAEVTVIMLRQIILDMSTHPNIIVSVNLHEQDWNNDRIMMALRSLYYTSPDIAKRIHIEILETVQLEQDEDIVKINELKQLWFQISIDDYGEGHSNLGRIIHVAPNNIKIDARIIKGLNNREKYRSTVAAIDGLIKHAREIGATVTAEYVEDEKVYILLEDKWVDFFQGYYFAKPVPIESIKIRDYKGEKR